MSDELRDLARAAAANVVTAIGTEAWPRMRAALHELLTRHSGDPASAAWVDTFGDMIANAVGREQMSLRDAAYARYEEVFIGLLTARPTAAAEVALLVMPGAPGAHSAPGAYPAPPAPDGSGSGRPDLLKGPVPPDPAAPAPGMPPAGMPPAGPPMAPQPVAAQPMPPGMPGAMPPVPPGPPGPPPAPYGAAPYGQPPHGHYPGPPPAAPNGGNRKWVLGIAAVVVVIGAVFGGIALLGDDDSGEDCAAAPSGRVAAASLADANRAAGSGDCAGSAGLPGSGGGSGGSSAKGGKSGSAAPSSEDLAGTYNGTFANEKPIKLQGPFTVTLEQKDTVLTANIELSASGCNVSATLSGPLNGERFSLETGPDEADQMLLQGKVSGDTLSGTYTILDCNNATGTWTARK